MALFLLCSLVYVNGRDSRMFPKDSTAARRSHIALLHDSKPTTEALSHINEKRDSSWGLITTLSLHDYFC